MFGISRFKAVIRFKNFLVCKRTMFQVYNMRSRTDLTFNLCYRWRLIIVIFEQLPSRLSNLPRWEFLFTHSIRLIPLSKDNPRSWLVFTLRYLLHSRLLPSSLANIQQIQIVKHDSSPHVDRLPHLLHKVLRQLITFGQNNFSLNLYLGWGIFSLQRLLKPLIWVPSMAIL